MASSSMIVLIMMAVCQTGVLSLQPKKDRVLQNYYYDDMEVDDDAQDHLNNDQVPVQDNQAEEQEQNHNDDDPVADFNDDQNHNDDDPVADFNPNQGTVPPYIPGPLGGSPNPFVGDSVGAPDSPVNDVAGANAPEIPQQGSPNPFHNITPSSEGGEQEWGHSTEDWGTHIPQHLAEAIWPLIFDDFSIYQWHQYFASYSWYEWAVASSDTVINGQMWSTQSWYNWYRDNMGRWSALVWTLCYLGVTPSMVARMMISVHGRAAAKAKSKL